MNWGRAKNLLIILFIITDIFLLILLLQIKFTASQIPEDIIEKTAIILQDHGIQVQSEQIPQKRVENRNVIMENFFRLPDEAANKLLGDEAQASVSNSQLYEYRYESPEGTLHIKDSGFTYQSKKTKKPYEADKLPSPEHLTEMVLRKLSDLGFSKRTTVVSRITNHDGIYGCVVEPTYENRKIYGIAMHITVDSEDILSIEGNWFTAEGSEAYGQEKLLDVTAVLTGLIYHEGKTPMTITDISFGYYAADDYLDSREIVAVPVYVITDEPGSIHVFDARVGTAIE